MQRFDPDIPTQLIQILPEPYRHIYYEEKHKWRDPPTGFFTKGGYLTVPTPDRLAPAWVQLPPSNNNPWDQTHTTFERFGMVADLMTPMLTIHRADGQQQTNPPTGGTMCVAGTTLGSGTVPGSGSMGQVVLVEQTPPEQEHLEEELFLEGEVPLGAEVPRVAAVIRQAAQEAIQEDCQAEEAHQEEESPQDGVHRLPEETA
ncbi:hypothetical protein WOLCODRAFT_155888 [Wolfiporia cocos MD-104 SS10]|uniref:Uncharacterized protein n=1 Tax=Wolfiporia cocos (strain MD-104) TaxID=742152 RepID=A0A2H3J0I4_WOLCO|nr:hypothetical protein WOLCODRAFT_155888 [Wolfiporia cocos MD-104 SS10]